MTKELATNDKAKPVRHEVAFQGYLKVGQYRFGHTLHGGGPSGVLTRKVFEHGQSGATLTALTSRW